MLLSVEAWTENTCLMFFSTSKYVLLVLRTFSFFKFVPFRKKQAMNVIVENTYGILKVNIISLYFLTLYTLLTYPPIRLGNCLRQGWISFPLCVFHRTKMFTCHSEWSIATWIEDASGANNLIQLSYLLISSWVSAIFLQPFFFLYILFIAQS